MNRRWWIFFVLALFLRCGPAWGAASPAMELLATGRQAYEAGDYAGAARAFDQAIRDDPGLADAPLCLDAAMASRLAGEPGRAVWWLYRARALAPADRAVAKALDAAGLDPRATDIFPGGWVGPRTLWSLVLGANAVFWLFLASARVCAWRLPRRGIGLAAVIVAGGWLVLGWSDWLGPIVTPYGVVVTAVEARSAPERAAAVLFRLQPGAVVVLGPVRQGAVRVEVGPARAGWIAREAVARVSP